MQIEDGRNRRKQVESFFTNHLDLIRLIAAQDGLNKEETEEFERRLRGWFGWFSVRGGNAGRPLAALRIGLLSAAYRYAVGFKAVRPCPPKTASGSEAEQKLEEKPPGDAPPQPGKEL